MGVSQVVAAAVAVTHHRTSVACHIRMIGGSIVVAFGGCINGYSVARGVGGECHGTICHGRSFGHVTWARVAVRGWGSSCSRSSLLVSFSGCPFV